MALSRPESALRCLERRLANLAGHAPTAWRQRGDAPVAAELIGLAPASTMLAADRAYDSDALRQLLIARGTIPVIPNGPRRKHLHPFDRDAYKRRNLVERAFCRLKDFRRIATRYDKLAATYAAAISLAAIIA